jgi:hypothetical protein
MIQFTAQQLYDAARTASRLRALEEGKDRLRPMTVQFDLGGDYRPEYFEVEVSAEAARKHANDLIAALHKELAALGIELLPGA